MLHLVPFHFGVILSAISVGPCLLNDPDTKRTGSQWLRSVKSYLQYRTGDSWRRLTDPADRWHPDRIWYLNGLDKIETFLSDDSGSLTVVTVARAALPLTLEEKTDRLRVAKLEAKPRAELVDLLMGVNPALTDRKLLSHLGRSKLARMIVDAQNSQPITYRRTA